LLEGRQIKLTINLLSFQFLLIDGCANSAGLCANVITLLIFGGDIMENVKSAKPNIIQVESPEDLAIAACNRFVQLGRKAIEKKGTFHVAISGGHTPTRFFQLLGICPISETIEWEKVQVFWVDERCVPPEAEASNYGLAAHTFLDKVPIPVSNVHRVTGECDDYGKAVSEYEETIRRVFGIKPGQMPQFDLIVLGMGSDGHIGSLFPNSYALFDTNDLVSPVYLMDGNYNRITLTHPVMCAASQLLILISGPEKAQIVREVLQSEYDDVKYPVHRLWPIINKVTWLIDGEAAKFL
jgi:6-phosphogluconolactonase